MMQHGWFALDTLGINLETAHAIMDTSHKDIHDKHLPHGRQDYCRDDFTSAPRGAFQGLPYTVLLCVVGKESARDMSDKARVYGSATREMYFDRQSFCK